MNFEDDKHIDVCQNIGFRLKEQYGLNFKITDSVCIFALENEKIAIKKSCAPTYVAPLFVAGDY